MVRCMRETDARRGKKRGSVRNAISSQSSIGSAGSGVERGCGCDDEEEEVDVVSLVDGVDLLNVRLLLLVDGCCWSWRSRSCEVISSGGETTAKGGEGAAKTTVCVL